MTQVFGSTYAGAYDAMYYDKDYQAECDLVHGLFKQYGQGPIKSVLDLGCGTGNHVFPLVERGCELVGVDLSEGMLTRARAKAASLGHANKPTFHQGDVRTADVGRTFDACLMMFAVLGYQLENADVLAALKTARKHLKPGGLFVFDVWYGPAVLALRPAAKFRIIPATNGRMLRYSLGELDVAKQRSSVYFHLWELEGDKVVREAEETHWMRYFFPLELAYFLETAGLQLVRLGAFPDFDKDPSEQTWNITGVARAV